MVAVAKRDERRRPHRQEPGLRKITVEVSDKDLAAAQAYTGQGVTETVRAALKKLAQARSQEEFRKLYGTYQFKLDLDELRKDREW